MASYDNSRYTYTQVLSGIGYYMQDSNLNFSLGVKDMQEKLNMAGCNCGIPDGKFGYKTNIAVRNFQASSGLTSDGKAGKITLTTLEKRISNQDFINNDIYLTIPMKLKKKFGSILSTFASQYNIDEDILGGFILTESSGYGFSDGNLLIRFENHIFLKQVDNASSFFKVQNKVHYYYMDNQWKKTHTNKQTSEYEAFRLAKNISEYYAYYSISMGLAQIMGFNFSIAGYDSPKTMFDDFSINEENQMNAFCRFIANYRNGTLLNACRNRDFTKMGDVYNGNGITYGPKLEANTTIFANA